MLVKKFGFDVGVKKKQKTISNLQVSFEQPLHILIGCVLSQSCLEVFQLVQQSIETLTELRTQTQQQLYNTQARLKHKDILSDQTE